MNTKLYVITAIFNPFGFQSRARLYRQFAQHMAQSGAELLTVEAAFGPHGKYEVTAPINPWHMRLRTDQVLWHKERMINLALKHLYELVPDAYYVAWIDADVTFANPDWVAETVRALAHYPVVQPFAEAINLSAREEYMWNCPSTFRSFLEGRGFHQTPAMPLAYIYKGHPGLAWAATRPALEALGGLYDVCAAGSGDTIMANCLKGGWDVFMPASPSPGMVASMQAYAARCDEHIRGRVGYVRGTLLHHWHGRSEARGYEKRWSILSYHQFDPATDLVMDTQGMYRWAGNKPRLEDDIRLSLGSRNEDEV